MFDFNFFSKKPQSVLGVDIGSSSVKIVQVAKKGGRAVLETYGELSLGPYGSTEIGRATSLPPEKISEALKDLMREAKTTATSCGVAIPFGSTFMTILEIPRVPEKELASVIPLEARKYIPVPISEVALDWWVIPREEESVLLMEGEKTAIQDQKISVLVVAIHNDTLAKYQDVVTKAGLKATFFEIEIFSAMRSVLENNFVPVMILDMGASSTKLYLIERGIIRSTHTVNRGSQDITLALSRALGVTVEKAEVMKRNIGLEEQETDKSVKDVVSLVIDAIFSEAEQVVMNYQRKYGKSVSQIVVTGGGVELKRLLDSARKDFQIEVMPADPFRKLDFPAFLSDTLKHVGPEFAIAVGAALRKLQELA